MDLLEMGSFLSVLYASIIPFYFMYRLYPGQRSFAILSAILGSMLLLHSVHHLGEFIGNSFLGGVFGLASAVMAVILGVAYSILKRMVS